PGGWRLSLTVGLRRVIGVAVHRLASEGAEPTRQVRPGPPFPDRRGWGFTPRRIDGARLLCDAVMRRLRCSDVLRARRRVERTGRAGNHADGKAESDSLVREGADHLAASPCSS